MSHKSRPNRAFHNVLEHYYDCKTSAFGGRSNTMYASLSNSVGKLCGKVRVSASDLVADVELASRRALRDYPAEYSVFKRIYLDADDQFKDVFSKKLGGGAFKGLTDELERRVGQEFIDAGIYPVQEYTRTVDTR